MKFTSYGGFLKWGGTPKSSIFLWDFAERIILGSTPILGNVNLMAHLLGLVIQTPFTITIHHHLYHLPSGKQT